MQSLQDKKEFLVRLSQLREKISSFKFVHVFVNDKFCKNIVEFICHNFDESEHCFVFIGGYSAEKFPLPDSKNVFSFQSPLCLANSQYVSKFIFHGLYHGDVIEHIYNNPDLLNKSYWVPWGWDIYEANDFPAAKYVKSNFQGVAGNALIKKVYQKKYGLGKVFFNFNFTYATIEYDKIIATKVVHKDYIQIMVNNSTHESTLEVFSALKKFKSENIRVTTVLSYGKQEWRDKILMAGKRIFGEKFFPIIDYLPADTYIKFLARNDIYILNQHRPQGMTTFFAMLLMGKKVFMRGEISAYLKEEGYMIYDTNLISDLSFTTLCAAEGREKNKFLAAKRFDNNYISECWKNLFQYQPDSKTQA